VARRCQPTRTNDQELKLLRLQIDLDHHETRKQLARLAELEREVSLHSQAIARIITHHD
jgi:hypothetical protein